MSVGILALLFTWQAIAVKGTISDAAGGCANGFIQLDMLRTLAQKIPNGRESNSRLNNELRLIPDWNFTCNGTITSFLMGADIRHVTGHRVRYPVVQIWRRKDPSLLSREYYLESFEEIRLNAGNFSPSGVLEYRLNNPFNFQAGDIFGVYQPEESSSVVRIYYNDSDSTAPVAYTTVTDSIGISYNIDTDLTRRSHQFLLILPITDSSCTKGFVSYEKLKNKAYDVNIFNELRRLVQHRIFPDINFTCSGNITKWIVGGTVGNDIGGEVQIWRKNDCSENDYTKVGYSILKATDPDNDHVYEYIPDPPLEFQEGDILGVYQQRGDMRVFYQDTTGPANYRRPGNVDVVPPAPATLNGATLVVSEYDYPLVTVEIVGSAPTSSNPSNSMLTSGSVVHCTSKFSALSSLQTSSASHIEPSQVPPVSRASPAGAVGGAIAALLILVVLAAAGATILMVVLVRRRNAQNAAVLSNNLPFNQVNKEKNETNGEMYLAVELYEPLKTTPENYIYAECNNNSDHVPGRDDYYSSLHTLSSENIKEDDDSLYWTPADDCSGIYEQFSSKGFRKIAPEQIIISIELGSGQFGRVNKGVWHSLGGPLDVAVKTLKEESTEEELIKFLQEAAIMGQFHHPNIVKLHGVVTMGELVMIVLELMNQDLRDHLFTLRPIPGKPAPQFLPQQLLWYCRQIASGMEYLSKKSFVHRDLAARNILVDDKRTCKIADFGMSRDLEDDNYYTSRGGMIPVKWTAIEAIYHRKYSTASDVWSFGVLMYEIWSLGHKPFDNLTNPQTVETIRNGVRLSPPPGCPRAIYKLMIQCWHPEASERPSFTSLVFKLSRPENQLLLWTDTHDPQSTMLGAPLETASSLHSHLQQHYT